MNYRKIDDGKDDLKNADESTQKLASTYLDNPIEYREAAKNSDAVLRGKFTQESDNE